MLPPPSARVAEYFDELSQRADAGDMSAACRLAYELDTCRRIPELQRYAAEIGSAAIARPKGATKAYDDLFVKTTLDIEVASRRCEGVQRAWMQNAWKYLFALARSGNDEAAVRFALAPPLDRADMIDNLDAWQVYRESAVPLLERAATNGDPHAMHALQLALSGTPVFLGSRTIIAKDPARALELGFALERVADAKTVAWLLQQRDELRATLSPEEFQRRSHAGTALYERLLASVEPLDFDSSSFRAEPESRCGQP